MFRGEVGHEAVVAGVAEGTGITGFLRYGLVASREMTRAGTPKTVAPLGTS